MGYVLDDKLYDNCYGNRLNESLLKNIKENKHPKFSPMLFKPYYKNYQSWRDNALNAVKTITNDKKHAIMLSLDFKDYYYRSLIDFNELKKDIEKTFNIMGEKEYFNGESSEFKNNLFDFVKSVFELYSSKFIRKSFNDKLLKNNNDNNCSNKLYDEKLPMIPLGFLPSLIIANWNLQGLDKSILEDVNPFYYGRYVDDILIVFESHERSGSFERTQFIEELDLNSILKKYFTPTETNPFNYIFEYCGDKDKDNNSVFRIYDMTCKNEHNKEIIYNYKNLRIQENKLKVYKFSYNFSNSIIENFKKTIFLNSSEFKLLHEYDSIINDLSDKCYNIDYNESINKLNNIKNIKINKYEISKLLSRLIYSSKSVNEVIDNDIVGEILSAFKFHLAEYMVLWEKLFSFLYINNCHGKLVELVQDIIKEIESIEFLTDKYIKNDYMFYLSVDKECDLNVLKNSLYTFLFSSLVRTLSLKSIDKKYSNKFNNIFKNLNLFNDCNDEKIIIGIKYFLSSLLQNNSFMNYPLQDTSDILRNLNSDKWYNYNLIKNLYSSYNLFNGIFPRFIKLNEFMSYTIHDNLFKKGKGAEEKVYKNILYIIRAMEYYKIINFKNYIGLYDKFENYSLNINLNNADFKVEDYNLNIYSKCKNVCDSCSKEKDFIIRVSNNEKEDIKVGLLNVKLDKNNIINKLKGKNNLNHKHFDSIKRLINRAIKKDVELLLMPEMYIPYEWVNDIVKISKDHQMAMIFGVEPIINENYIGNYIMASLPFVIDEEYYESVLLYRLKNHYAPEEFKIFKKYDKIPIKNSTICSDFSKEYHLIIWNGIYIVPYYCYEIADIHDRMLFKNCCDIVTVSEFNKDTIYFNNIAESLSRDLFCYCVKSNTSEFGGSSILQPSSSQNRYIVNLKGGDDDYIVTCNLDIKKLREESIKNDIFNDSSDLKPKLPGLNREIIRNRMN